MGRSETMFTVPVTRGSRMKLRPVCWPTVLMTDWMSAFTKLTVIFSSSSGAAKAGAAQHAARTMAAKALLNFFTITFFSLDFSGVFSRISVHHGQAFRDVFARACKLAAQSAVRAGFPYKTEEKAR